LPDRDSLAALLPKPSERHFFADVLIPLESPLIGKTISAARFTPERGLRVVDILRNDRSYRREMQELILQAGDRLVIHSKVGDMLGLREAGDVAFGGCGAHAFEPIAARETVLMEGVVGPQPRLAGRRVADLNLRRLYGAYILAIHRQGENLGGNFDELRLRMGDTVLLEGPPESMRQIFDYQELANLMGASEKPLRRNKAPIAIAVVVAVMGLAAFEVYPIALLALMAATAVVMLGCLEVEEAYNCIRWNILMLIFAMLALGIAMEKTGAAAFVIENLVHLVGGFGPVVALSAIYFITSLITEIMSNNATAILLTPIAIGLAHQMGVDPRPFVVAVMFAASQSFATPIGYQTNTFVYNAGGYRFTDFVKVGTPLNILLWLVASFVIPLIWPLS
jgi:di/tricarboxylate transporter